MAEPIAEGAAPRHITVRQAAFIGVAAMVGAGIFSLLAPAGEVAGAAVWLSFVIAGIIAMLQGYSFAKFGARYPSAGGLLEYVRGGFGNGHLTGVTAWLVYSANTIVTAMVAVSFGSYASAIFTNDNKAWAKVFAVLVLVVMTALNVIGSQVVARTQSVVVVIVIGILVVFSVVTLVNIHPHLLAPSGYPPFKDIMSAVALTFFSFLGFGIVTFTAKDLAQPRRELPRAIFLALGIATAIYIAISLGVFGTLTVDKVIASGATAIAEAAKPALGQAGFYLMSITALFATAGATNGGLYPAVGLSQNMVETGQFPPFMDRRFAGRAQLGLLIVTAACAVMVLGFDLTAIASIGSAVALLIFVMITAAHLRVRKETGASLLMLLLAIVTASIAFLTFLLTTLRDEPASLVALLVFIGLSIVADIAWKRVRDHRSAEPPSAPLEPADG
jgi:amino acid transporter